jgi:hypothetical protein
MRKNTSGRSSILNMSCACVRWINLYYLEDNGQSIQTLAYKCTQKKKPFEDLLPRGRRYLIQCVKVRYIETNIWLIHQVYLSSQSLTDSPFLSTRIYATVSKHPHLSCDNLMIHIYNPLIMCYWLVCLQSTNISLRAEKDEIEIKLHGFERRTQLMDGMLLSFLLHMMNS